MRSFYSSKIVHRLQIGTLEKLLAYINSEIIEKGMVYDLSVIIDEFVRFHSSIIKSMWEASIVGELVVEFEFEY